MSDSTNLLREGVLHAKKVSDATSDLLNLLVTDEGQKIYVAMTNEMRRAVCDLMMANNRCIAHLNEMSDYAKSLEVLNTIDPAMGGE